MKQNHLNDNQEVKYILRQIGFGAVLGAAFLHPRLLIVGKGVAEYL